MKSLGLDIGTNSVGSAWVDTKERRIWMGDSVFPAGVEESDMKRGAPKNQARRGYRSQHRNTRRRSERKHQMRTFLLEKGWMPAESTRQNEWLKHKNPWILRSEGLERKLKPFEFGRVLLHMAQQRGAYGLIEDEDEKEDGKIKKAVSHVRREMNQCKARTFGELMALKFCERRKKVGKKNKEIHMPIRNRTNAAKEGVYEFCADRRLIREEFDNLWKRQKSFGGELGLELTDECRRELDDPSGDETWRYRGILFGQRRTYWDIGTMARCDLEPTDLRCSKGDMYAQEFLVLQTVNNIRIMQRGEQKRPLSEEERRAVIDVLEQQKKANEGTIRKALGIHRGERKTQFTLSLEKDPERGLNTSWFRRDIVIGAIGKDLWEGMSIEKKDSVNKAILKFDPNDEKDVKRLREGCSKWWGFDKKRSERFVEAWKGRPRIDDRINYSRRAVKNLLPYMREGFPVNEARKLFVEDATHGASDEQRRRYSFGAQPGNRALRRYMEKHPDLLPPVPEDINNPVVRKAIHEVRHHIQAYIRRFVCRPDRVVVELVREARQSAFVRNRQLAENRAREKERKKIIEEFNLTGETKTQQRKTVDRVLLSREQRFWCAYCSDTISERDAARGNDVEVDHIIPQSRGGNSFLSNLILCHTRCNRGKGNKTPMEWLTKEEFGLIERRLKHLEKENKVKWENLHSEAPDLDKFVESQLTDTAYAARQVVAWLEKTLYGDKNDGSRHVFTTKGRYTAILRRDWRLFPDKNAGEKNRADHRHHAVDAVLIALSGPERLSQLACSAEKWELAKGEGKAPPEREPLGAPWGDRDSFRAEVMKEWQRLVVAHRPEKRKITGPLHNDTQFGPVLDEKGHLTGEFTIRKFAAELTPNHLRVPEGWEQLRTKLENCNSKAEKRGIRAKMLAIADVKCGKSGIVRDRWFREELRDCLRRNGLNVDVCKEKDKNLREKKMMEFTKKLKEIVKGEGLFLESGVPLRRITLVRNPTVVEIRRKRWNSDTEKMEYDPNRRSWRYYEPQNNHHIEIRESGKGRWVGEVISNFDAVKRVRPSKESGFQPQPAVNRNDTKKGRFVMSLSIGEMIYMKHPETGEPEYFVVFKLDGKGYIHFTPHWDAGKDKATEKHPAREDIRLSARKLQGLGVGPDKCPTKQWVGPLGDSKPLYCD